MKDKWIYLSEEEQEYLHKIVKTGTHSARMITRARVLLMLDRTGKKDHVRYNRIAENAGLSVTSVYNMRDKFLECHDLEKYLNRKKREIPPTAPILDGEGEAKVIALACSKPPEGCARWSLSLLAKKTVELHYAEKISPMTIQRLLKKRNISLT